jgi:hypothetical protein
MVPLSRSGYGLTIPRNGDNDNQDSINPNYAILYIDHGIGYGKGRTGCREGGVMNRIERKEAVAGAAKLFQDEVLELQPDIPRGDLCGMVDEYVYYQQDDMTRTEAHKVVKKTCWSTNPDEEKPAPKG